MSSIRVKNTRSLLSFGNIRERRWILDSISQGLHSVEPANLLRENVKVNAHTLFLANRHKAFDLKSYDKVFVIGGGKASGAMAEALEELLGDYISTGYVNVLSGTIKRFHTEKIKLNEASHPVPNQSGVNGTREMVKLLRNSNEKTFLICLISGGGSSLIPLPAKGISLKDLIRTTDLLLRSGADIDRMNCIRKHISGVKGGQLARYASRSTILCLIISDVVGDHLESIASGPTVPDPTTFSDARKILVDLDIFHRVPSSVRKRVSEGCKGLIPETPKFNDPVFSNVTNLVIGSNRIACERIKSFLSKKKQLQVSYLESSITGEASIVARDLISRIERCSRTSSKPTHAFIWGGETTVTVKGNGVGGRNQEEALSALESIGKLWNSNITIAFFGTDGIDGKTNAAGALVDRFTLERAQKMGLDIKDYLGRNDSNSFFRRVRNSLIITDATGTNVNDVGIAIRNSRKEHR